MPHSFKNAIEKIKILSKHGFHLVGDVPDVEQLWGAFSKFNFFLFQREGSYYQFSLPYITADEFPILSDKDKLIFPIGFNLIDTGNFIYTLTQYKHGDMLKHVFLIRRDCTKFGHPYLIPPVDSKIATVGGELFFFQHKLILINNKSGNFQVKEEIVKPLIGYVLGENGEKTFKPLFTSTEVTAAIKEIENNERQPHVSLSISSLTALTPFTSPPCTPSSSRSSSPKGKRMSASSHPRKMSSCVSLAGSPVFAGISEEISDANLRKEHLERKGRALHSPLASPLYSQSKHIFHIPFSLQTNPNLLTSPTSIRPNNPTGDANAEESNDLEYSDNFLTSPRTHRSFRRDSEASTTTRSLTTPQSTAFGIFSSVKSNIVSQSNQEIREANEELQVHDVVKIDERVRIDTHFLNF